MVFTALFWSCFLTNPSENIIIIIIINIITITIIMAVWDTSLCRYN